MITHFSFINTERLDEAEQFLLSQGFERVGHRPIVYGGLCVSLARKTFFKIAFSTNALIKVVTDFEEMQNLCKEDSNAT